MEGNVTMMARDAINAKLAECYVTIGNNRYNFMQMRNFEAKFEKSKQEVPILGKTANGNKSTGWKGTFSANMYYNTSVMREMMVQFKDTGADVYFDIQITNEDPSSSAGRQTMTFIDCNIDGGVLAKFDATSNDPLNEDVNGTFEDFKMPEKFNILDGMLTS